MDEDKRLKAKRDLMFLICIWYEGPWAKMSNWCYGIRKDGTMLWDIPANPRGLKWVLSEIARWADEKDRDWRAGYADSGRKPSWIWKRRA